MAPGGGGNDTKRLLEQFAAELPSWIDRNSYDSPAGRTQTPMDTLKEIARPLYRAVITSGRGSFFDPEVNESETQEPSLSSTGAVLAPMPDQELLGHTADLLARTTLYSDLTVVVAPFAFNRLYLTYSASGTIRRDSSGHKEVLGLNHKFGSIVSSGRAVILPRSFRDDLERADGRWERIEYLAPLEQRYDQGSYLPANYLPKRIGASPIHDLAFFDRVLLPYFPEASLDDIVKVAEVETDSFLRFGRFLNRKVRGIATAEDGQAIYDLMEEIRDGAELARQQAKKIAKSKLLRNSQIGLFGVSIGMLLVPAVIAKDIAAISGSASLWHLMQAHIGLQKEAIEIRSHDFYVPYLLLKES